MISVIIPAYNAEKFIGNAIESIVNQTYRDTEIIVINDGSTDATKKIVEKYIETTPNILLINVENGGVSRARNIGIENAKGEFIAFLDADDIYLPNALQEMYDCIIKYQADVCSADLQSDSSFIKNSNVFRIETWDDKTAIKNIIIDYKAVSSSCAKLYKTSKIKFIKFPEGKRAHEDSFFVFLCIMSKLKFVEYNIPLYQFTVNPNSASRSGFSEKMFDILYLAEEKYNILTEAYPELKEQALNIKIKAHMALLNNLCKTKDKKYCTYEKASIRFIKNNKKAFIYERSNDRKWFFIISHGLYSVFKFIYIKKNKI